jgi:hypothetical protein
MSTPQRVEFPYWVAWAIHTPINIFNRAHYISCKKMSISHAFHVVLPALS